MVAGTGRSVPCERGSDAWQVAGAGQARARKAATQRSMAAWHCSARAAPGTDREAEAALCSSNRHSRVRASSAAHAPRRSWRQSRRRPQTHNTYYYRDRGSEESDEATALARQGAGQSEAAAARVPFASWNAREIRLARSSRLTFI